MTDREEFERLSRAVEDARRERDRARGREESLLDRLRNEHGCGSIKEAKRKARRLEKELANLRDEFATELEKFKKEWKVINDSE